MTRIDRKSALRTLRGIGRRFRRDVKGIAAVETALIMPTLLLLMIAAADITQVFSANRKVTLAANTVADLVAQSPGGEITEGGLDGLYNAVIPILGPFGDGKFGLSIYVYRRDPASGGASKRWEYSQGNITCTPPANIKSKVKPLVAAGNDVVFAVGCIKIAALTTTFFNRPQMLLKDQVFLRPRETETIVCKDC